MPYPRTRTVEILILQGVRIFSRCLLQPGSYHIGQERTNEIMADEPSISGHHAYVTIAEGDAISILDLESSNGTFVDGVFAAEPLAIVPGVRVQIGACEIQWRERSR